MAGSLFSQSWYRVSNLKPRLRSHVQVRRHTYRGRRWFVIQDRSTGQFHRYTPEAHLIIGLLDGSRTLQEIWEIACERLGDDMPTQDEVIALLSQLYQSDILQADILPDTEELYKRYQRVKRSRLIQQMKSPLAVRIPLLDPDRFLTSSSMVAKVLYNWFGAATWLITIIAAAVLAFMQWDSLVDNSIDQIFSLENLIILWFVYPLVKLLHEFGHAYAVKRWGGEVHEMGLMFLVFIPVPYVDASSSSIFRDKRKRMLVSSAGILVEVFLAALAMVVWTLVEPGIVRSIAYNVMLIAGVSTLIFNGNPLLRFDAYYILSDFLEMPNLGKRANQYIGYLLQRYIFGVQDATTPVQAQGEAKWLGFYSIASFCYRMIIMIAITLFVASKFFVIGIILACWAFYSMLIAPILKIFGQVFTDSRLYKIRNRIFWTAGIFISLVVGFILLIPMPYSTMTEGVVWAPEQSQVRAGTNGFVTEILVEPGRVVRRNTPLIRSDNPDLLARVNILQGQLKEAEARLQASVKERAEARIIQEEIKKISAELDRAKEKTNALVIKSSTEGVFLLPNRDDLPGMFVTRGAALGYVVNYTDVTVRAVVEQDYVDQVRNKISRVEVMLAEDIGTVVSASVLREVPAATKELPSMALSIQGGGRHALDPSDADRQQSFEKLFQFDIKLDNIRVESVGERVFVRFVHGAEPLAMRWYRGIRQMLLSRFDV